jgi:hypothetical protein
MRGVRIKTIKGKVSKKPVVYVEKVKSPDLIQGIMIKRLIKRRKRGILHSSAHLHLPGPRGGKQLVRRSCGATACCRCLLPNRGVNTHYSIGGV